MPMYRRQAAVLLLLTGLALGVTFFLWPSAEPADGSWIDLASRERSEGLKRCAESDKPLAANDGAAEETLTPDGKLIVYIVGAVKKPGVVEVAANSRVEAAIKAAGGATVTADLEKLNLAQPLKDGEKISVPYRVVSQEPKAGGGFSPAERAGRAARSRGLNGGGEIVHINTATQAELESLPGIGPALARRIISYRTRNGDFRTVEELRAVSGIGAAKMAAMREYLAL